MRCQTARAMIKVCQKLEFPVARKKRMLSSSPLTHYDPQAPRGRVWKLLLFPQPPKDPWGKDILFRSREAGNCGYHVKYPPELPCLLHETAGTMLSQNQGIWLIWKKKMHFYDQNSLESIKGFAIQKFNDKIQFDNQSHLIWADEISVAAFSKNAMFL